MTSIIVGITVIVIGVFALVAGVLALTVLGTKAVIGIIDTGIRNQQDISDRTMASISEMLRDTVIQTVQSTTQGVMASMVGEKGVAVDQGKVPDEEDLNNPVWTQWDDGDGDMEAPGIGDSVLFQRVDGGSRVVGIEEGESIIPGVPLPDMTGEGWQPA